MSERSRPPVAEPLDTREVAGKGERGRRRRKRTTEATTVRRIQAKARERQDAWLETGQPNKTFQLTRELTVLYGAHREEQAGTLTTPYCGRTSAVKPA